MEGTRSSWEVVRPLGSGGQSEVSLVRGTERISARTKDIKRIHEYNPWTSSQEAKRTGEFVNAVADFAREDRTSELGAMKIFKVRGEGQEVERLRREVAVLKQNRSGLPDLLDSNVNERWIVTEFFPRGTFEQNFSLYKGDAHRALRAFLSLAKTIAALHADGIIHRDIKPANIFVREDDTLVLGDFGIVFLPDQPLRVTLTNESVGPHDYMPPWAEVEGRLAEVITAFDVYMLGKLLWCMVTGRLRLQREYFDLPDNDVTVIFRDDPAMHMIQIVLRRCVVERGSDCKTSASELVLIVSTFLQMLERGGQLLHAGIPRPCRVCGKGEYRREGFPATQPPIPKEESVGLRFVIGGSDPVTIPVFPYVCNTCGHVEFFTRDAREPNV